MRSGSVSHYLDTSFLATLFRPEALSERADGFLSENQTGWSVSDLGVAEFASAVARWVRTGELNIRVARTIFETFDAWLTRSALYVEISPRDVTLAATFLRRLDLPLRTPDAIHIAIAGRLGAVLVTFDRRMAASARALGAAVAEP